MKIKAKIVKTLFFFPVVNIDDNDNTDEMIIVIVSIRK